MLHAQKQASCEPSARKTQHLSVIVVLLEAHHCDDSSSSSSQSADEEVERHVQLRKKQILLVHRVKYFWKHIQFILLCTHNPSDPRRNGLVMIVSGNYIRETCFVPTVS